MQISKKQKVLIITAVAFIKNNPARFNEGLEFYGKGYSKAKEAYFNAASWWGIKKYARPFFVKEMFKLFESSHQVIGIYNKKNTVEINKR